MKNVTKQKSKVAQLRKEKVNNTLTQKQLEFVIGGPVGSRGTVTTVQQGVPN